MQMGWRDDISVDERRIMALSAGQKGSFEVEARVVLSPQARRLFGLTLLFRVL